jgi:hypothetical protein
MMEHPIQPFNLVIEDKEEDYDRIDPIHYKDMFAIPDTFSQAWENKSLWQSMEWRYANQTRDDEDGSNETMAA